MSTRGLSNPVVQNFPSLIEGQIPSFAELPVLRDSSAAVLDEIRQLKSELARRNETILVPIVTLAPEPYRLLHEILALVQAVDDGFTATFFDANISTSGDTQEEAVSNLRSLILDTFEYLESEPIEALGPEPARQFGVLRAFVERA
jgi:hypothetical protein